MRNQEDQQKEIVLDEKKIQKIKQVIKKIDKLNDELKNLINFNVKNIYNIDTKNTDNFILGVFNGKEMVDENDKTYQVPENYASKTKLICGDKMKLVITDDGTFVYKQIEPVKRKKIIGDLAKDGDEFVVKVDDKKYRVLKASISFYKAQVGDQMTILIPDKNTEVDWAAIENKIQ